MTRAADLLLSSRVVLAEEAEQLGLVNRALPPDELLAATYAYARTLAREIAPSSLAATKLQLYRDLHADAASSVHDASARMAEMMKGPDFAEGVAALTEKRPPDFPDRPGLRRRGAPARRQPSAVAVSRQPSAVDAGGELGRVPSEQRHRLAEGEAVGHPRHVRHRGADRVLAAGEHVGRRAAADAASSPTRCGRSAKCSTSARRTATTASP